MKALLICLLLLTPFLAQATDSESFALIGGLPGGTEQAVVVGEVAYCATYGGLLVLDVADPTRMSQLAMVPLSGWGRRVAVNDGLAYVLSYMGGLAIVDVSEPAAPVVVGECPEVLLGGGVAVAGEYAFVANRTDGLVVIDVTDPSAPDVVAAVGLPGEFYCLTLAGDLAYLAADDAGLHVVDLSDPLAPALVASVDFPGVVRDVAVAGDVAYLAAGSAGVRVLDMSDPAAPAEIIQLRLYYHHSWALFAHAISVADGLACVGLGGYGLGLVDVTDPSAPSELTLHEIPGDPMDSDRHGDRAYVAAYHGGLAALDLADPGAPVDLGRFGLVGAAADLAVRDGLVYVAGGYGSPEEKDSRAVYLCGLFVVDAREVTTPAVIGYGATWYQPPRLTLAGQRAFLAVPYGGTRIFDVAEPTAPVEVGWIPNTAEMYEIAAAGDLVFHFDGSEFVVTDVSDPAKPAVLGSLEGNFYGHLTEHRGYVYSVSGYPGVQVIDVRDPGHPVWVSSLELSGTASAAVVAGEHLMVPNGPHGLLVVDVQDPADPVAMGSCPLPGIATGVACRWPYAYVSTLDYSLDAGGIHVVDISDPAAPTLVTSGEIAREAVGVANEGTRVYVAANWGGVLIFEHDVTTGTLIPVTKAALLPNHPNPFNPRTKIRWDQVAAGHAELAVFDMAGRRVRTLVAGPRPAGRQHVVWDGRDDGGREVSAGVYLYRLRAAGRVEARPMVLVR